MKTTAKHFKLFKKECERWITIFGLLNWTVHYYHEEDGDPNVFAWTQYNHDNRVVDVSLNRVWANKPRDIEYELKRAAFHEVCEILLYPLRYLGEARFITSGEIDTGVHNVIRILENVVWKQAKL